MGRFYTFGYINGTPSASEITYADVDDSSPGLQSTYRILNGERIERPQNPATVDTGTTLILLDSILVQRIMMS